VKPGGLIVCAAECRDGFPEHGGYREFLAAQPSPRALLAAISSARSAIPDQWQVQIQAGIQTRADVVMHTSYLTDDQLREVHLAQTNDISRTVLRALDTAGESGRVCVLPEGPQTIAYVEGA